jgi:hypothetical protein
MKFLDGFFASIDGHDDRKRTIRTGTYSLHIINHDSDSGAEATKMMWL